MHVDIGSEMGMKEQRLVWKQTPNTLGSNTGFSEPSDRLCTLTGITRIRESTVDAVGGIMKGTGKILSGEPLKGLAKVGESVFNILDIPASAVADFSTAITRPVDRKPGTSEYGLNVSRALGSFKEAKRPTEFIGATIDTIHAIGFRAGSDILRIIQKN
ncbi:hypothetical protein COU76_04515 [Candidatus Peregrinibacteria bacterium CG10_big_fil_rev_8_21_14_0_10_49_10]|nr:MAG: hypothetical protein COU76_04515 [Candidatus Peregrinibacteria bacterium CG10_big_fil_rev_8_21_14_0_10_49_10]